VDREPVRHHKHPAQPARPGEHGEWTGCLPGKTAIASGRCQVQKLTDEQSRQLKVILDQLSPSDIELFKQFSVKNPGGDPERFINSLRLFQSAKSEFEKQHPPSAPPDLADDASKALRVRWTNIATT